jgi:parallel beta-helix repeat protein
MKIKKTITSICAIVLILSSLAILTITFNPLIVPTVMAESNAPPENGSTNKVWYIEANDKISRDDETISTIDIQINSTGMMEWINVTCETTGDITINNGGTFNVTNSTITLKGDFIVKGVVYFDNVTLIMNSTYDGEFEITVDKAGSFFVEESNITAYNTWTPSDLDTGVAGFETWGYHYNFTVYGNLSMIYSDVSYVWGRITVIAPMQQYIRPTRGIYISPSDGSVVDITYSNFTKMETCALNIAGSTENINISHNRIYDIGDVPTWYGFGIYSSTSYNAMIRYNEINNCTASGIYLDRTNCTVYSNNISYNGVMDGWTYTSGLISWVSTPKIIQNNISDNYGDTAIFIRGITTDCLVKNNNVFHNNNTGIEVVMGDPVIENNNINNNTGDGVLISTWKVIGTTPRGIGSSSGQVRDNIIEFNNHTGLDCDNTFITFPFLITTEIDNNTINNNNQSGLSALNCNPDIINNSIFNNQEYGIWLILQSNSYVYNNIIINNTYSGLYATSSSPTILENNISLNNRTGIECVSSSSPTVEYNDIYNNDLDGIYLISNSDATIRYNDILYNNWSGIWSSGSSPSIGYNNINLNNQNGLYLHQRGSTAIRVQYNNLTYNGWNGIECNLSSPAISMNNLTNNSKNGVFLNNSSPTIQNNNQIMYNQHNGIACYLGSAPTIRNDLKFNTINGLYVNGSSPVVRNTMISNNSANGIFAVAGSNPSIENSSVEGNSVFAFNITGNSHVAALNTTMDTQAYFGDLASTFSVQWFLHVKTMNENDVLLPLTDIWVNTTTQTPSGVWSGQTDGLGFRKWIHVNDFVKTDNNGDHDGDDPGEITNWNPYNISADTFGYGVGYAYPEPTIDHSMWVTVKLPKNGNPTPVSNIKPDITHSLRPELTWDAAIDPENDPLMYYINVGLWPNGTNVVFNESTSNTNYTFSLDLSYGSDGNNTYYVLIYADDGDGGFSRVNDEFYVINHDPTKPGINITPENPTTLIKSLTCTIDTISTDQDGDDITYTYRWYKNGAPVSSLVESGTTDLSDTISVLTDEITFEIGDVWMCRVTANDGIVTSLRDEDSVTFGNLIPVVTSISDLDIDEDTEVTNWINLSEIFADPDPPEDGTPYKFWVTGNVNLTINIKPDGYVDVKPILNWNGQETITFWANDTGSKTPQVQTDAVINVLPVNDAPSLVSVDNVEVEEGTSIAFLDTKGALQDREFRVQIVCSDIDIEKGETDTLVYSTNSTDITIISDSLDPLKANLTFTPDNTDVLKKTIFLRLEVRDLEDGIIDDFVNLIIEVRNINDPPVILSFYNEGLDESFDVIESDSLRYVEFLKTDNCAYEDQWFNLTIFGYDPDPDDVISYDTDDKRFMIKSDPGDDKYIGRISFKPSQAEVGEITFNITAQDTENGKDIVRLKLLIKNVNDAPDAKILKPTRREFDIGETIDFEGDLYDEDLPDDSHTFTWTSNLDGELGTTITLDDVELSTGIHTITFTVKDSSGASGSMVIKITVGGEDTDMDGLPDSWEEQYFGNLEWGPDDDPDNDKLSNLEEYDLKSDPSDPESPTPQTKKDSGDDESDMAMMVGVAVLIIVIIIIIIVFIVLKKRKAQAEGVPPEGGPVAGGVQAEVPREKMGYSARPVPTLDELFPEGVPEEEIDLGKPEPPAEKEPKEKKGKPLPVEIGLPPEELRKELRKKSKREEEIETAEDKDAEDVLFRPEADQELIFERPDHVKEFRPVEEAPEHIEHKLPDSPFATAQIKELDGASDEPIFMEREPEDLDELYKEEEEVEDLDDEE